MSLKNKLSYSVVMGILGILMISVALLLPVKHEYKVECIQGQLFKVKYNKQGKILNTVSLNASCIE